jgi:hypothetical protein
MEETALEKQSNQSGLVTIIHKFTLNLFIMVKRSPNEMKTPSLKKSLELLEDA